MEIVKASLTVVKPHIKKIILSILLLCIGVIMLLPLLWMISSSLKYESDIFTSPIQWIPRRIQYNNYKMALFEYPYLKWYLNSFKVTLGALIIGLSSYSMAGYALARMKFKGSAFILLLFVGTLMVPDEIRILPQFILFKQIGLYNTHAALVLPWLFNGFGIFLLCQFFRGVPYELTESAKLDGANEMRVFYQVILPLSKPAVISLIIIIFNWSWSQMYMAPLVFIRDINKQVLSVGITTFADKYVNNFGAQMAGYSLALIPVIVVFLVLQKHFVEGIAMTGIK